MRLTFFGAAGEVTGSAYVLQTDRGRILIDFGMHQGEDEAVEHNKMPRALEPARLDAVLLTHAHLDHCGRLPMLPPGGFKGPVWATPATIEMSEIILKDSATLQENDATRTNNARMQQGLPPINPLYGIEDVSRLVKLFRPVKYSESLDIVPGISARYFDSGHILGAASIEVTVTEGNRRVVIVFSGDIGPRGIPLIKDPTLFKTADVALLESTYGDRDHRSREETIAEFDGILGDCRGKCGKVLIPAFAVGRTQDLIYEMGRLYRAGRMDGAPVFVDSPMARDVTALYKAHQELFDAGARELLANGDSPLSFPTLRFVQSVDESKKINDMNGVIVIAASGMCTGGRIVHHLKHNIAKTDTHVVIVGYQAEGTLGRRLVNGERRVKILGDWIPVNAKIHTLGGFSAHAGQSGLMEWAAAFDPKPGRLILTHGEPTARDALASKLKAELGISADRPLMGDTYEL